MSSNVTLDFSKTQKSPLQVPKGTTYPGPGGESPFGQFPFHTLSDYWKKRYGAKVQKIPLDAGLGCPHRDERRGRGGCTYCDEFGSGSQNIRPKFDLSEQAKTAVTEMLERKRAKYFYAYFQSYTNTFAAPAELERLYESAISHENIVGLSIGTRPDLLPEKTLDLLARFNEKVDVALELGVQSFHDPTLTWFNRAHDNDSTINAIKKLKSRGIETVVHLIYGSPTDQAEQNLINAEILNEYKIDGVKFHNLMVIENTTLADNYRETPFELPDIDAYIESVITTLEKLNPKCVVHRTHGTVDRPELLIAPPWSGTRNLNWPKDYLIQKMRKKNTWQGKKFEENHVKRS